MQGLSRYEVMTKPTEAIRYRGVRSAQHTIFTGPPLPAGAALLGWAVAELWVESSDADADVFVYLEDYDPVTEKARCGGMGPWPHSVLIFDRDARRICTDCELRGSMRAVPMYCSCGWYSNKLRDAPKRMPTCAGT